MQNKVMISCPIRNRGKIVDTYLSKIKKLNYDLKNIILYFVLNNSEDNTEEKLLKFKNENDYLFNDIIIDKKDECGGIVYDRNEMRKLAMYDRLSKLRNIIIQKAIELNVDYLFSVDSDILISQDSLIRLIEHNKDVVSAVVKNCNCDNHYNYMFYNKIRKRFERNKFKFSDKGLIKVDLTGACVLISKKALQFAKYYSRPSGEDEGFALEMMKNNISMYVDTNLKMQHIYNIEDYVIYGVTL